MKTKHIPAIVMLLGGSVACIVTYINRYSLREMLVTLTFSLVIFLIIGGVIKMILDSFQMPDEAKVDDEGEVVEKQGDEEADEDSLRTTDASDEIINKTEDDNMMG